MTSSEERVLVLKMVQEGKITPEMAADLLRALDSSSRADNRQEGASIPQPRGGGRFFRIRITDKDSNHTRVNVRLPLGMVNASLRMGMHFAPEVEGLDPAKLAEALNSGRTGRIMEIFDDEENEHVEIYIE